jgi:ATP-dependent Clp protease ATP-binding subunit ClpC
VDVEGLGESAKLVLGYARRAAEDLGHAAVGTEHLFLGIVELEDVPIRRLFLARAVDVDEVSLALKNRLGPGSSSVGEPMFTPAAERGLETAAEAAAQLGARSVEAPHVLIGVLADHDGAVARLLADSGADIADLTRGVVTMLERGAWTPATFYRGRRTIEQSPIAKTSPVLESLGRDLTAAAERGELVPLVGRERELAGVVEILSGSRKRNAVLVGEPGVGKTAIVEGLAQWILAGRVPADLRGARVRTVEIGALLAGTAFRGELEGRLRTLIAEVRGHDDVILFVDEIHQLVEVADGRGGLGAASTLKPVLAEGSLRVIGATTPAEFRARFEQDRSLAPRFQPVTVGEPSREEAVAILAGVRPRYEEFHRLEIADAALDAAVELSRRYVHDRYLPDKALDVLDRACTQRRLGSGSVPSDAPVGAGDVAEVVSVMVEVPIARLTTDERQRLLGLADALRERVIGQEEAVDAVAQTIVAARVGLADTDRPFGAFLFLGPSGVGKTKLAEELGAFLFGDRDEVVRLDMSEFGERHTVSALIGSPPGYVGWEAGGRLTNAVRARPYAVVLLDEVEKAHPHVWNLFLQVLEDGRLTDGLGRLVDFRNTVIVMTSNVGSRRLQPSAPLGFGLPGGDGGPSVTELKQEATDELRRIFPPEFVNRIDEVVVFRPLDRTALRKIVRALLDEMIPMTLHASKGALDLLVEQSYEPALGARPARRAIQRLVRNPLSLMLARGEIGDGDAVSLRVRNGSLRVARASR